MSDLKELTQWLDHNELNNVQKSFSEMTGMSAQAISMDGECLTEKTGCTRFCDELVGKCPRAGKLCEQCRKFGAQEAADIESGTAYYCHMGLVEFAAPIKIEGVLAAYVVGGMVFENAPDEDHIREQAEYYGIDPDELWKAAKEIPVCGKIDIVKSVRFLYNISKVMAETAGSRIQMEKAASELRRASQMKTDFLANMSHEIRTPMNAVIGMADIALQEEMSPAAENYVRQIQSSGKALLHIINDILDYSKISSGKMDIIEDDYEPGHVVRDVSTIIMNRLKDKRRDVSLIIDYEPGIPLKLTGDGQRIQQILINLANNAVKFTNKGYVKLSFKAARTSQNNVNFEFSVTDTGIGIKNNDMGKLFKSFSQVDSKRNRNVEGTGLGLAIVEQLAGLMGGSVKVESEYGKGSIFSVSIPQKIAAEENSVKAGDGRSVAVASLFANKDNLANFTHMMDMLGVQLQPFVAPVGNKNVIDNWLKERKNKECFVFIEQECMPESFYSKKTSALEYPENVHFVLVADAFIDERDWRDKKFFKIIRSPLMIFDVADTLFREKNVVKTDETVKTEAKGVNFKAPDALVLVVDDNRTNMIVAEKLLMRTGVKVDKAYSGKEALDLIVVKDYDLIFMDHMMPELDGIDTTRIIRRFYPKFNGIPIIALTANAMGDVKKMFLEEGMNDYLAKPIDRHLLNEKLLQWLPKEKIIFDEVDSDTKA